MVALRKGCCRLVKNVFRHPYHPKQCPRTKNGCVEKGSFFNNYTTEKEFIDNEDYVMCYTLHSQFERGAIPIAPSPPPPPPLPEEKVLPPAPTIVTPQKTSMPTDRYETITLLRDYNRLIDEMTDLHLQNQLLRGLLFDKDDEDEIPSDNLLPATTSNDIKNDMMDPSSPPIKKRKYEKLQSKVISSSNDNSTYNFRKPYHLLTRRHQLSRIHELLVHVMLNCLDKASLQKETHYYITNETFANEVSVLFNDLKFEIEKHIKLTLPSEPEPLETDEEREKQIQIDDDFVKQSNLEVAITILKETTGRGYDRVVSVVNKVVEVFGLPSLHLPSNHMVMKDAAMKVEAVKFEIELDEKTIAMNEKKKKLIYGSADANVKMEDQDILTFFEKTGNIQEESSDKPDEQTNKQLIYGAKLEGEYNSYLDLLIQKNGSYFE
jgi:hypothetical protein